MKTNTKRVWCVSAVIDPGTKVQQTIRCYRTVELPETFESPAEQRRITNALLKKAVGFSVKQEKTDNVYKRNRPQRGGVQWLSLVEV